MNTTQRNSRLGTAVLALWLFATTPGTAQNNAAPDVLLQRAIQTETVDGDLPAAIELYKQIVNTSGTSRSVTATALLHLGQAHEKLGNAEARQAYERIARDFADQKDVAANAERCLAAMNGPLASGRPSSSLVWRSPNAPLGGSVSSDGRYLSFVDWATGDLALRDLTTGQERRVAEAKNEPNAYNTFAEESVISRDGRLVAYNWFEKNKGRPTLRIASLSGDPNPRQLYDNPNVDWIEPRDFSPDGKSISVLIAFQNGHDCIGLISVADGSLSVLRSGEWRGDTRIFFSPDGKYVGYDLPQGDSNERDVWVTATDGTGHKAVVAHRSNDVMMGWSPDGTRLLFCSDRTGSATLWSLPISDGKPRGAPEMIKAGMGETESLGVTRAGAMFYGVRVGRAREGSIQIGSFDFSSGSVESPREVSDDYLEDNTNPCWSSDGKYFAYISARARGRMVVVIRSAETNRVIRELPHELRRPAGLADWEPNGRALLVAGADREGRWGAFRVDVETGEMKLLFEIPPRWPSHLPVWSADGRTVYYHSMSAGAEEHIILQRDIESGAEKELLRRPGLGGIALSPDGNYLATATVDPSKNERLILLIALRGGKPREMMRISSNVGPADLKNVATRGASVGPVVWAQDSRSFIVRKRSAPEAEDELWEVPIDGRSPRKLDSMLAPHIFRFAVSPDGRKVVFRQKESSAPTSRKDREVWALENFLPAEK